MGNPHAVKDLLVRTANPQMLDQTVQQLGAACVVDGSWDGDVCRVRVFGDPGYFRFAITNQGYGEVIGEEPVAPGLPASREVAHREIEERVSPHVAESAKYAYDVIFGHRPPTGQRDQGGDVTR